MVLAYESSASWVVTSERVLAMICPNCKESITVIVQSDSHGVRGQLRTEGKSAFAARALSVACVDCKEIWYWFEVGSFNGGWRLESS